MTQIAAIVLAAGASRRMGTQKLLLPLGGRPLVRHVVEAALSSAADRVVIVVGQDADDILRALAPGRHSVVRNPDAATGMASSLRAGLRALPSHVDGALVLLGDQPLVDRQTIDRMCSAASQAADHILLAAYAHRHGHPVYFPARLFDELATIAGDEGGRSVVARHRDMTLDVELGDARDIDADTPEAYEALLHEWERRYRFVD